MADAQSTGGGKLKKGWKAIKRLAKGTPGPFDYGLLPLTSIEETRYVQLFAADEDDEIEIDMVVANIKQKYAFAALSYVWGSEANPLPVYMGTYPRYVFNVTRNLHAAMLHVRRSIAKGKSIFIWIDALCINQQDKAEKAQQIPLMRYIYTEANATFCWLGEGTETTKATFDFFVECYDAAMTKNQAASRALLERLAAELDQQDQPLITGIRTFLRHPWFERAWILQEACRPLDDTPMLFQGNSSMNLVGLLPVMTFMQAPYIDGGPTKSFYDESCLPAFSCAAIATTSRDEMTVTKLLVAMSRRKAGVPRDKLYALLGLLPHPERFPKPDYEQPEIQVCREFTRCTIMHEQSLHVLTLMKPVESQESSWCLNLDRMLTEHTRPSRRLADGTILNDYTAAGTAPLVIPANQDLSDPVLKLPGMIVDVVETVYDLGFLYRLRDAGNSGWTAVHTTLVDTRRELRLPDGPDSIVNLARAITCDCFFSVYTTQRAFQHDHLDQFYACYVEASAARSMAATLSQDELLDWAQAHLNPSSRPTTSQIELDNTIAKILMQKAAGIWTHAVRGAIVSGHRFMSTKAGRIGWVPSTTKAGDSITLLPGSAVPMILRKDETKGWRYLGAAPYIDGMMYGELFQASMLEELEIV